METALAARQSQQGVSGTPHAQAAGEGAPAQAALPSMPGMLLPCGVIEKYRYFTILFEVYLLFCFHHFVSPHPHPLPIFFFYMVEFLTIFHFYPFQEFQEKYLEEFLDWLVLEVGGGGGRKSEWLGVFLFFLSNRISMLLFLFLPF